jgi:sec-independent protein translocase protein TatA
MFGLGAPELLLIMGIVIIIFGAGKLPEVGAAMGKSIREFRSATEEATNKETVKDTAA